MSRYHHKQHGRFHWLVYLIALMMLVLAVLFYQIENKALLALLYTVLAAVLSLVASMFHHLTITDEGEHLRLAFGPLPVFGKDIDYSTITRVTKGRSSILDGWGIHWIPGRGWTYNIWGRDCLELEMRTKRLRLGTDDQEALFQLVQQKQATSVD